MHWLQKLRLLWIDGGKAFGTVTDSACGYSTAYMGSGFLFFFLIRSSIVPESWVSSFSAQKMYNCRLENCLLMALVPYRFLASSEGGWRYPALTPVHDTFWDPVRLCWSGCHESAYELIQDNWLGDIFSRLESWSSWQGDTCSNAFLESDRDATTYIDTPESFLPLTPC